MEEKIKDLPFEEKAKERQEASRPILDVFWSWVRLPLTNNLCESHIRPFATARRAWLFADTPKGAKASAVLYTLVESAKANALDVYGYLKYLLTEMSNNCIPNTRRSSIDTCHGRQSCQESAG